MFTAGSVWRASMRYLAKFCVNRSNRCGDMAVFWFFNIEAILDLLYACLDHPWSVVGGLYRCAKFGCNWHCSFEDMRFSMLCEFGLKCLFMPLLGCSFGGRMGENGKFMQFYPFRNAVSWVWCLMNQTTSKLFLRFSRWMLAKIWVTNKKTKKSKTVQERECYFTHLPGRHIGEIGLNFDMWVISPAILW